MRVVFQGRHGAYSESAALHFFAKGNAYSQIETIPTDTFAELHEQVQNGTADFGVIPIENSTAGSILENYDLLLKCRPAIIGELKLQIDHCLIALKGERIEDLQKVISHQQALEQCSVFFDEHPKLEKKPFFDTAGAAERIAKKQLRGTGCIASSFAAEFYGLEVLKSPLANFPGSNFTRFLAIKKGGQEIKPEHNKTSIAFSIKQNAAGVLHECLGCFAKQNVDLIRIESRPKSGSPFEYIFYADFAGNPSQKWVAIALEELSAIADVVLLGSYIMGEVRGVKF